MSDDPKLKIDQTTAGVKDAVKKVSVTIVCAGGPATPSKATSGLSFGGCETYDGRLNRIQPILRPTLHPVTKAAYGLAQRITKR